MKVARTGQATPLTQKTYEQISDGFLGESYKIFWALAWYTGEKLDAILNLDVLCVYQNPLQGKTRDTIIYHPSSCRKDKKIREVFVHRNLFSILSAYQPPSHGFLFPSLYTPERHVSYQALNKAFKRAVEKADLDKKGYSLMSPRIGFVTHLCETNAIYIQHLLTGHASISSLIRYIEVSDKQLRNTIKKF